MFVSKSKKKIKSVSTALTDTRIPSNTSNGTLLRKRKLRTLFLITKIKNN